MVGGVDGDTSLGCGRGERDVAFQTAGPHASGAAGWGSPEPRVVRAEAERTKFVADADDSDRQARAQRAVGSQRVREHVAYEADRAGARECVADTVIIWLCVYLCGAHSRAAGP
jgi:hypothetical protein